MTERIEGMKTGVTMAYDTQVTKRNRKNKIGAQVAVNFMQNGTVPGWNNGFIPLIGKSENT